MTEDKKQIEFILPEDIRYFVFDLHDSCRRALRVEEVQINYEIKFKELTEKYFAKSAWPEAANVAYECSNDENFLLFYKYVVRCKILTVILFYASGR